ncbi:RNA polymerase sigma factor [Magnetovirga frankeli]|nr:RNA polymerase sigma factor [gamma proteobacterium SS-5]
MQQEQRRSALEAFLAGVERRALVMTQLSCGDPDQAQDLLQDAMAAFVRAYANKPETDWPPLFHRTLQNRIRDHHRRRAVRRRHLFSFSPEQDEDNPLENLPGRASEGPEQRLQLADASEALVQGLARLPPRQRQAVLLRIWEGLDLAQTAQVMGCSGGSVKTHLSRALQTLRAKLAEHWQ